MPRLVVASIWLGVLGAALWGCGGGTAPASRERMLVYRGASGPVYLGLRDHFQEVRSGTEPSSLDNYSLVMLDGNAVAPSEMASLSVIRHAMTSGISVLLVNATEGHKRALLDAKLVPISARGMSEAYLITPLPGGRRFHVTNLHPMSLKQRLVHQEHDASGYLSGTHDEGVREAPLSDEQVASFVQKVRERVADQGQAVPASPTPPSDYPKSSWFEVSVTDGWALKNDPDIGGQSVDYSGTYTFYGYFDSGDTLRSKWFQWLALAADSSISPSAPVNDQVDNRGFVPTLNEIFAAPVNTFAGNGLQLSLVQAQPTSANNSLSTSLEFNIGYKGQTSNSAWLWQQSLNQSLGSFGGWTTSVLPPPSNDVNAPLIQYMQTTPCNGDASNVLEAYYTVFVGKHIYPMNASSRAPMGLVAQSLWRTQEAFSGVVQIQVGSSAAFLDLAVTNYFFAYRIAYSLVSFGGSHLYDVDLGQLTAP